MGFSAGCPAERCSSSHSWLRYRMRECRDDSHLSCLFSEVSVILELGNVWVFVHLIFCPNWPMNQLNKNPNIAHLQDSRYHCLCQDSIVCGIHATFDNYFMSHDLAWKLFPFPIRPYTWYAGKIMLKPELLTIMIATRFLDLIARSQPIPTDYRHNRWPIIVLHLPEFWSRLWFRSRVID